jgi:serine/threonine protein kinase
MESILIDGRYKVTAKLGQGQFGVVYRAEDQRLPRTVAIKMLRQEALDSEDSVRRFKDEACLLCQVLHPHVLQVFDQGLHEGKHYIAFAFIEGRTVKDVIEAEGVLDPIRACRLVARLAGALHYVYAKHKILHRDVKPANLMLADGDDNALYLMDFGLAVCHQADVTRATVDGTVMGTPAYMSPEQARGHLNEIDHRSDVYSTAVVLFHLLTGQVPFNSPWPGLVIDIIQSPPPRPSSLRPGLDPQLEQIVLKGLAKDPSQRYQTGKEFAEALEQWVTGPRVAAVPAGVRVVRQPPKATAAFAAPSAPPTSSAPNPVVPTPQESEPAPKTLISWWELNAGSSAGAATAPATPNSSPELPNQGSSVVNTSTVNNLPRPAASLSVPPAPVSPFATGLPAGGSQVVRKLLSNSVPPSGLQRRSQWTTLNVLLVLVALGVYLLGFSALFWALLPEKKNTSPTQKETKNINAFR